MGSVRQYSKKQTAGSGKAREKDAEYTSKGNRLYRFRVVSKEELEKLRIPIYSYLL
ncbi:MAG: hypothetical protein PHI28_01575 [Mangrovibacterium sp.]|nr:hypothetical protein [Mangrovibacterium sp.]